VSGLDSRDELLAEAPRARVAAAQKLISKPRDLIGEVEGRHVALLAVRFGEHVFEGADGPTATADIMVVDVEADPPRPLAGLSVSWRRVVAALRLAAPGTWVVGRLQREAEFSAVELLEPVPGFDLDRVALQLGELEQAGVGGAGQLALPIVDAETVQNGDGAADDDIPF
jgi:hypothetical protein